MLRSARVSTRPSTISAMHPRSTAAGSPLGQYLALAIVPLLAATCFALGSVGCKGTETVDDNSNRTGNTNTARPVNNGSMSSGGNNAGASNSGNGASNGSGNSNSVFANNAGGSGNSASSNNGSSSNAANNGGAATNNGGSASTNNAAGSNDSNGFNAALTEDARTAYQASIRLFRAQDLQAARDVLGAYSNQLDEIEPSLAQSIRLMECHLRVKIDLEQIPTDNASRKRVPVLLTMQDDQELLGWLTVADFDRYKSWRPNTNSSAFVLLRLQAARESYTTAFMRDVESVAEVRDRSALETFYEQAAEAARTRYLASDRGPLARAWLAFALARWAKLLRDQRMTEEAVDQLNRSLIETEPAGVLLDGSMRLAADPEYHQYLADLLTGANASLQPDRLTTILRRYPHAWQWHEHGIVETRDNRPHFLPRDINAAHAQYTERIFAQIEAGIADIERAVPGASLGSDIDDLVLSSDLNAILVKAAELRDAAVAADRRAVEDSDDATNHLDAAIVNFAVARALYKRANELRAGDYRADVVDLNRSIFWVNMRRPY